MRFRLTVLVIGFCAAIRMTAGAQPVVYPEVLSSPLLPDYGAGKSLNSVIVNDWRGPLLVWAAVDEADSLAHVSIARLDSIGNAVRVTRLPIASGANASANFLRVASDGANIIVLWTQTFAPYAVHTVGQRLDSSLVPVGDPVALPDQSGLGRFVFRNGRFIWYGTRDTPGLSFTAATLASPVVTADKSLCYAGEQQLASGATACAFAAVNHCVHEFGSFCSGGSTYVSFYHDDGRFEAFQYSFPISFGPAFAAGDSFFLFVWRSAADDKDGSLFALLTSPPATFEEPLTRSDQIVIDPVLRSAPLDGAYAAFDGERFGIVWTVQMQLRFATLDPRTGQVSNFTTLDSEPPRPWFYWTRQDTKVTAIGRGRFLISYELGLDPSPLLPGATHVLAGRVISVPLPPSRGRVVR